MGADKTLLLVLMAVASVGFGAWDLWKGKARDLLLAVSGAELTLLVGAGLETFLPGGLAIGAVVGALVGVKGVARIRAARKEELRQALAAAPDSGSRMLVLYDRVDSQSIVESSYQEVYRVLGVGLLAILGIGLMVMGATYDTWQALFTGVGLTFWPVSHMAREVVIEGERSRMAAEITSLNDAEALPAPEAVDRRPEDS